MQIEPRRLLVAKPFWGCRVASRTVRCISTGTYVSRSIQCAERTARISQCAKQTAQINQCAERTGQFNQLYSSCDRNALVYVVVVLLHIHTSLLLTYVRILKRITVSVDYYSSVLYSDISDITTFKSTTSSTVAKSLLVYIEPAHFLLFSGRGLECIPLEQS